MMSQTEAESQSGEPKNLLEYFATQLFFLVSSAEDVKKRLDVPEIKNLFEEIFVTCPDEYPYKVGPKHLIVRLSKIRESNLPKVIKNLRAQGIIPVETEKIGRHDNTEEMFYNIVVYSGPQWWSWLLGIIDEARQ